HGAVVDACFSAARGGAFAALGAELDPAVVRRGAVGAKHPAAAQVRHGAAAVAGQALLFARADVQAHPALVNGAAAVVATVDGQPVAVMGCTVSNGKIVAINAIADPERVRRIAAAVFPDKEP